jgi:hemerythrin-like metal-binding protein
MPYVRKPRPFAWEAHYEIGFPEIDQQHRVLLGLINRVLEAVGSATQDARLNAAIPELVRFASHHFATEEALMAAHSIDTGLVSEHALAHQRFCTFVLSRLGRLGDPVASVDFARFLISWFEHHIVGYDEPMARALRRAGAAAPAEPTGVAG